MSMISKAPQIIWSKDDQEYYLSGFTKFSPRAIILDYKSIKDNSCINLFPALVETEYFREKPVTQQPTILQGKYECAPAALAMSLGESLFKVKRQMGKLQWRNDNYGVTDELMRATAQAFGRDLIEIPMSELSPATGPCILTVKSLNVKGYSHAVTWTGKELLDPNTNYPGRHYWGSDWTPDMIEATCCHLLLDRVLSISETQEYQKHLKESNLKKNNKVTIKNIISISNSHSLEV